MALEVIGGSILSPVIQVLVDRLASRQVLGFFKSHKLDDSLLEKLNETLNTVNGLLDDAEEKQITNRAVKNWLNDVKYAVYEAEDILEEIDYEYLRSQDIDRPDRDWARNLFPFLNPANRRMKEMEVKLQKTLEKLESLLKQNSDLRPKASSRPGRKRKTVAGSRNDHVTIAIDVDMNDRENGTGEVAEKLLDAGESSRPGVSMLCMKLRTYWRRLIMNVYDPRTLMLNMLSMELRTGEVADAGESSRPGEKSGWTLLMTNLILEFASAVFDQLGYASIGMVLAFVALLLATAELIYMARKEKMSLLPCFHRPSTGTSAHGETVGTIVEYFGLVGAVWQCFYSTVEYAYASQKKDNPIKMSLLPFLFLLCVVFCKLIKK